MVYINVYSTISRDTVSSYLADVFRWNLAKIPYSLCEWAFWRGFQHQRSKV